MFRAASVTTLLLLSATSAFAQRADENAVKSADDAFGTSVGNEKIGLYSQNDVRGFSPTVAGNIRIEGLAVTEHGGFSPRIAAASTIRVGLTAQGYPFPAPTGIADIALRRAGANPVVSAILYAGPNDTLALDLDAQLPLVRDRLSLAAGVAFRREENFPGEDGRSFQGGGVLRWRASPRLAATAFYNRVAIMGDRDIGNIFSGGAYLPPRIARRYFGLDWTRNELRRHFYGGLVDARVSEAWRVSAGLFRSDNHVQLNPVELYRDVQPDGAARRQVVTTRDQRAGSTSGEIRSSFTAIGNKRRHVLHVAVRGRDTVRMLGGADVRDLGAATIGRPRDIAEPEFRFGPLTRDHVRQLTGGIGYELRWLGLGEFAVGVQRARYRKTIAAPGQPVLNLDADPWLFNATGALYLGERLVAYGGYTRGLEDSATAPAEAVNRNTAPPALLTSQRDAGLRYAFAGGLKLIAGVFDIRKPYFNLDPERVYRALGTVRHRGVELSIAGQPLPGLSLVAGAVLLDADVSGEAVALGIIGPKPVGTASRTARVNLDYRPPTLAQVSFDLGATLIGEKIASRLGFAELDGRQLTTLGRTAFDLGVRYRFRIGRAAATLRAQVTNLLNTFGWDVSANAAFKFNDERRFLLQLATDVVA